MSRRKQMKPHHLHTDSEGEEGKGCRNGEMRPARLEPQPLESTASPSKADTARPSPQDSDKGDNAGDLQHASKDEGEENLTATPSSHDSKDKGEETVRAKPAADPPSSATSAPPEITRPPKKRGRPPLSLSQRKPVPDYSKSHSSIVTALELAAASPRRQSSRLQRTPPVVASSGRGRPPDTSGKKMSHRTCQYCGVVKPTPAALQRHIRKHTGERPFVCQVCQKAYKAKRSLHCHQITNHPELMDGGGGDIEPVMTAATVSSSTSNLLRETLETRRMGRHGDVDFQLMPDYIKSFMAAASKDNTGEGKEPGEITSPPVLFDTSKIPASAETTHDLSINVSTLNFSSDEVIDVDGEESANDLARRSCPHCRKVFSKPSDMKRHLMVHTGERPYVCQYCNKAFKQPGSLNYHLKASHDQDIQLSQGLEERYLRLKTRSASRSLAAMDGWAARFDQDGSAASSRFTSHLSAATFADAEEMTDPADLDMNTNHHRPHQKPSPPPSFPQSFTSCSPSSTSFQSHDLGQGTASLMSEGSSSWGPGAESGPGGMTPNVVEVAVPQFISLDGTGEGIRMTSTSVQMAVGKETTLLTQLDGTCTTNGRYMQVYKCCMCHKVCSSLFLAFSHLAMHFDPKVKASSVALECSVCCLSFKTQAEMAQHFHSQHGESMTANDSDLQNNNHNNIASFNTPASFPPSSSVSKGSGEEDVGEEESDKPSGQAGDDLNNNNNHINKQYLCSTSTSTGELCSSGQQTDGEGCSNTNDSQGGKDSVNDLPCSSSPPPPPQSLNNSSGLSSDDPPQEGLEPLPAYPSKGAHRCPKCSKCYMTQFLLDRHVAFHTRQDLIQAAMRSGARVNGAQKDLLLQPPPVLPQDSNHFLRLKELSGAAGEELLGEDRQGEGEEMTSSREEQEGDSDLDTKALLQKEGIQEDVTVVMPAAPEADDGEMMTEDITSPEAMVTDEGLPEIVSAPKRQLIPQKAEAPLTKSRRKSSLPHKFQSAHRESAKALSGLSTTSTTTAAPSSPEGLSTQQPPNSGPSSANQHQDPSSSSPPQSSSPQQQEAEPSALENVDDISEEFQREFLRTQQQSTYFQSLHAAFGNLSAGLLGNPFPSGNGLPPATASALALAAASGYLRNLPSLPGRPPFSLHGSASVSNSTPSPGPSPVKQPHPLSRAGSPSPRSLQDGEERAEDLSLSSGSVASPSPSPSSNSALPGPHPDKLVGFPRVLWETPQRSGEGGDGADGRRDGEEDLSLSPPPYSLSSSGNGKHLNPVWHTLSTEDLRDATTTDGRKVTSLSRTHSRLYVVNQPVDRERICKPTALPDGRTVFRCVFCHKDFLSYSDINRHMDFHEDIRPYKCNFCDYYARTNSQLKVHMMRHQGIREYCCRLCNYKGVTQSDLNRHTKSQIHLLKSRNVCVRCQEGFVTAKNLEKHLLAGCDGTHKMDLKENC